MSSIRTTASPSGNSAAVQTRVTGGGGHRVDADPGHLHLRPLRPRLRGSELQRRPGQRRRRKSRPSSSTRTKSATSRASAAALDRHRRLLLRLRELQLPIIGRQRRHHPDHLRQRAEGGSRPGRVRRHLGPDPRPALLPELLAGLHAILTGCSGSVRPAAARPRRARSAWSTPTTRTRSRRAQGPRRVRARWPRATRASGATPLPNAPRNKVAVNGSYTWRFDPGNLTLTGSYAWRDVTYGTAFRRNYDAAPSWDDFDIRAPVDRRSRPLRGDRLRPQRLQHPQYSNGVGGAGLLGNNATSTTSSGRS